MKVALLFPEMGKPRGLLVTSFGPELTNGLSSVASNCKVVSAAILSSRAKTCEANTLDSRQIGSRIASFVLGPCS